MTTTTTTSTVYGPMPKMDIVEHVVQLESSLQQLLYVAAGEGSWEEGTSHHPQ